jgi:hypothetical protein
MIELSNDFHGTRSATRGGMISAARVKRIRRKMCGHRGCTCASTILGTRGEQPAPLVIEEQPDGRAWVERASKEQGA